jgi:hypothetical protein
VEEIRKSKWWFGFHAPVHYWSDVYNGIDPIFELQLRVRSFESEFIWGTRGAYCCSEAWHACCVVGSTPISGINGSIRGCYAMVAKPWL